MPDSLTPRHFIVVRQSPDWRNTPHAELTDEFEAQARAFCRLIGEPEELVVETARLWDRTFAVSFRETRAAMKDIALENLRAVRDATLLLGQEDAPAPPADGVPSALYFFCDDDDWAHPDLFHVLRTVGEADTFEGYLWPHIVFGRPAGPLVRVRPDEAHCHTNNYAVTDRCLRRGPDAWRGVYQHFDAHKTFPSLRVCRVPTPLSATNKNPSSTLFLRNNLEGDFSSERLARIVTEFCRRVRESDAEADSGEDQVAWVRPWGGAVGKFYGNLLASRR